jgi:NADH:ubiquinone reductase (H+-translocating)
VVIIGAGFGGLSAARGLRRADVDVVLVDQNNYHLFTPLLYEVGTALLDSSEIAYPVRGIFHHVPNVDFRKGRVVEINLDAREVRTAEGRLAYDYLVVSAGSVNNFFGNQSAARNAFALKDMGEALALRNQILARFEEASWTDDPERRRMLMSFVVVGGGPTGVEFAGALSELVHLVLRKDFPRLRLEEVEIHLVEAVDHVLGAFDTRLQTWAVARLQRMGVDVVLGAARRDRSAGGAAQDRRRPPGSDRRVDGGRQGFGSGRTARHRAAARGTGAGLPKPAASRPP